MPYRLKNNFRAQRIHTPKSFKSKYNLKIPAKGNSERSHFVISFVSSLTWTLAD